MGVFGSPCGNAAGEDFPLVNFLILPSGVVAIHMNPWKLSNNSFFPTPKKKKRRDLRVRGVAGVEEAGEEDGIEEDSTVTVRFGLLAELWRTMVMALETGTGGASPGGWTEETGVERELYFLSFPRPESGAGPASVSSQILWRKPMMICIYIFFLFPKFFNNRDWLQLG